jgi:iron complex outermembrane receptor protein
MIIFPSARSVLTFVLVFAASAFIAEGVRAAGMDAQGDGAIGGTVTDVERQPLAGVAVTLDGPGVRRNAVSGADGTYRFEGLPSGTYGITFERAGFRDWTLDVDVSAGGSTTQLDAALEVSFVDTVTVTAQRREESLQDVPMSVTALTGDVLRLGGATDVSRLQMLTPGLNFARAGDDARPALRGARTENVSAVNDPVVGFHVDGVPRGRFSQALHPFVDVERVEVQRGPQGTLFGRNTFGGNINVITRTPGRTLDYDATLTLGAYMRRRLEGAFGAPLGDRAEFRVAGLVERRDGFLENTGSGPDMWDENLEYLRGSVRVRPAASVELLGRLSYFDQAGHGQGDFGLQVLGTLRDPATGRISLDGVLDPVSSRRGAQGAPRDTAWAFARDIPLSRDNGETSGALEATWHAGALRVKSTTSSTRFSGFRQNDGDFSGNVHAAESLDERLDSFTQEVQVASAGAGRVQWVAGVFHLRDDLRYRFVFDRLTLDVDTDGDPETASAATEVSSPGVDVQNLETLDTTSSALFGEATVTLTPALRATAGARWTRDEKTYSLLNELTGRYNVGFQGASIENLNNSWSKATWKGGLDYRLAPDHLLYGTVSTGFVAGGFAAAAPTLVYRPQEVTAWEVGSKSQVGTRTLLNVAAYYADYEDLLANAYGTLTGVFFVYQTNAGTVTSRGVEIEVDSRPMPELHLLAHAAFQDSTYGDFILPNPFPRGGDPSLPGNLVDLSGNRVQQQPKARLAGAASYDIDLGRRGTFTLGAQAYYSSRFGVNDIVLGRDAVSIQKGYTKSDLHAAWTPAGGRFEIRAFVENLENEPVLLRLVRGGEDILQGAYAAPRTWGVTMSVRP